MKRIIILITIALVTAGMLIADEAILIDFSLLTADIYVRAHPNDEGPGPRDPEFNQNLQTLMDYGSIAGGSFTERDKALMKTSLAINNWDVVFNSSSRTITNMERTYTRESASRQWGTVMGVRVHFPVGPAYSKATVRPPFEIPAYERQAEMTETERGVWEINYPDRTPDGRLNDGIMRRSRFESPDPDARDPMVPAYGVVKNVGVIRSVQVNAYGLNFPHRLFVILIDSEGNEKICEMGTLNFDGWRELTWNNPQYVMEVRNRDLRLYPLYPNTMPFIKFGGFRIDRDADHIGGDFVTYFKDVKLIYDKATLDTPRDIDDEDIWGIIYNREEARKVFEMERFGQNQILRYIENQRRASENFEPLRRDYGFTPTPTNDQ